jgi:hypothetical protein
MTRVYVFSSLIFLGFVASSCGGDHDSGVGGGKADGGTASQGGSTNATTSTAKGGVSGKGGSSATTEKREEPTWKYPSDDEGVFPKDRVLDIQVTMPEAAWNNLIATAKQEVWSTADVAIDGQKLGSIGFRPKGEYSLDSCVGDTGELTCDKLSFKLKFDEVDPEGRFYGLKRLALNQITDAGGLYMETMGYRIFKDFGITTPRTSYATLQVNGKSLGIYTVVEIPDGRFTDHYFGGNGNLYKEAWPDRTDSGYFINALETNKETANNEVFVEFATDMLKASDQDLPATLSKYMDLEKLLDYMAVDYAIANWDGITTFYAGSWGHANHNYFMYQDENQARFTLIPWDLNATFFLEHWLGDIEPWDKLDADCEKMVLTEGSTDLYTIPASCDPMIRAIALSKEGYHASVRRLLDEVFVVDKLSAQLDEYAEQLSKVMQNDPFISPSEVTGGAVYMKGQFKILRSRLEEVVKP